MMIDVGRHSTRTLARGKEPYTSAGGKVYLRGLGAIMGRSWGRKFDANDVKTGQTIDS